MYKGKSTCRELKRIRKMIAEQNNIPLEDSECHYEGDCAGTCPKCDAEVRFLENALRKSKQLGKVVTLSGAALAFSACGIQSHVKPNMETTADSIAVVQEEDFADSNKICENEKNDSLDEKFILVGTVLETFPVFKGGEEAFMKYIEENLVYPEKAKEDSITGKVVVRFVVEADGSITNVEVIRSSNKILDKEAVRVIKNMPKWIPGKQEKTPVRMVMVVPINFQME